MSKEKKMRWRLMNNWVSELDSRDGHMVINGEDIEIHLPAWETEEEMLRWTAVADLIAAAPDLLAALESMMTVYESLKEGEQEWHHYEQNATDARDAIANARGEE